MLYKVAYRDQCWLWEPGPQSDIINSMADLMTVEKCVNVFVHRRNMTVTNKKN